MASVDAVAAIGPAWWLPLPAVPPSEVTVRVVESAVILPLRVAVLRIGRPDLPATYALDDGPATLHLAVVDDAGIVLGTGTIYPERPPAEVGDASRAWLRLVGMAVDPAAQGRGVGGLVLSVVLAAADRAGLPVWATARDTALAFYARHGFTTLPGGFVTATGIPHHHVVREPPR
jgi:GNAT superfamily N-acetyltransferase